MDFRRLWPSTMRKGGVQERLNELALRAELISVWERLWPALVLLLVVGGFFVAVSWLGLWLDLPRWGRIGGDVIFAVAAAAALFFIVRIKRPSRVEALARLDRDSGLLHRPASALDDRLANAEGDPATRTLWEVHRRRAQAAAAALKLKLPSPQVSARDRFAIRAAALIALVAAGFIAGPEKYARLIAAFDWQTAGTIPQGFRLDAWVDPPAYTGRPPIMLNVKGDAATTKRIETPIGSNVIVRSSSGASVTVDASGALEAAKTDPTAAKTASPPSTVPPTTSVQQNRASRGRQRKSLDVARRRPSRRPALRQRARRLRHNVHTRQAAGHFAGRRAEVECPRIPHVALQDRRRLRRHRRRGRFFQTHRRQQAGDRPRPRRPAEDAACVAVRSRRPRRGGDDHRSRRQSVGRRRGHAGSLGQGRRRQRGAERSGPIDLAATLLHQAVGPGARRRAPQSRSRPRRPPFRRHRNRRSDDRSGNVRNGFGDLSRPEFHRHSTETSAERSRSGRCRRSDVANGVTYRGRRLVQCRT